MFDVFRGLFGLVYVREVDNTIVIGGINVKQFQADITKIWGSARVVNTMFSTMKKNYITFDRFFGVDVLYMFQQVYEYKLRKSSQYRMRQVVELLKKETWLKTLDTEYPSIIDYSRLNEMYHTLYPHQLEAVKAYDKKVPRMKLKGFLLAADVGTGKTIISLAIALGVQADKVILVVPKQILDTVWVKSIKEEFGNDVSYWSSSEKAPLSPDFRFYIFHYERLNQAVELAAAINNNKICVILDESHNLNDITSQRSQMFVKMCKASKSNNIIFSSGTAVKALGFEVITLLRCIDDFFVPSVEERFKKVFGISSKRAVDILRHRIDLIGHKIPKSVVMKISPPIVKQMKIRIPDGMRYTISNVQAEMKEYIAERIRYYEKNMPEYVAIYDSCIRIYSDKVITRTQKDEFRHYLDSIRLIRRGYDSTAHKEIVKFCNAFEKNRILPVLNPIQRKQFKDSSTIIKYVSLKVLGEALGNVLMKRRSECHTTMIRYAGLEDIVSEADKKTLCFSSFVEVVKEAGRYFEEKGFAPRLVYGETNKDVNNIVKSYISDPQVNPLIATYKSLSVGVTLIEANVVLLFDLPFRDYIREQAVHRVFRIGQDAQCYIFEFTLDTGSEPNISTRANDIMEWSREQVNAIMGKDMPTDEAIGIVKNFHLNPETNFERILNKVRSLFR